MYTSQKVLGERCYEEAMKGDLFFLLLALRELPEDIKFTEIKLEIAKDLFKSYSQV